MNARNSQLLEQRFSAHPLKSNVASALSAAERAAERIAEIRNNGDLSLDGRRKQIVAQARGALRDIRDEAEPIGEMKAKLSDIQSSIRKPVFDKTDVAGALARQEIRAALRGMSTTEKAALLVGDAADERFALAALEQPAILSGVPQEIYDRAMAQHLEGRFAAEIAQGEELDAQIQEAEAGFEVSRGDISRAATLPKHEFDQLLEEIHSKRNPVWLKRDTDANGSEKIFVNWPLEGNVRRIATADDLHNGRYYSSYEEYLADRAA
jgi:hypothetical protein